MSKVLSILDENRRHDINAVEEFVRRRSLLDVISLSQGLRQALVEDAQSVIAARPTSFLNEANFLPSSSLRGSSGCLHWNCRIPKAETLSRYVGLYCDHAVIPIKFGDLGGNPESEVWDRLSTGGSLGTLITVRPLVEAGLALLVPEQLHFCEEHWLKAVPRFKEILKAADKLAETHAREFQVRYEIDRVGPHKMTRLTYNGPQEFLDHGTANRIVHGVPRWLAGVHAARAGKVPHATVQKRGLLQPLFRTMANDAFLQACFGTAFNARYVTDLPGEAEFFQTLNAKDALTVRTAALCATLTHSIPLLGSVPLETILRVRREEPEVFANYRSALTTIAKNHVAQGGAIGPGEAQEIYKDILEPRLVELRAQARNLQRSAVQSGLLKVAATSALVGIGIHTGILPADLTKLVTVIGGFNVAKDLAETLGKIVQKPTEIRNHNLYFLLRLQGEKTKNRPIPQ